jgi:hypothetical protein
MPETAANIVELASGVRVRIRVATPAALAVATL